MTEDEEKAKEYVRNEVCIKNCPYCFTIKCLFDVDKCHYTRKRYKTYLDGLAEGRKENTELKAQIEKMKSFINSEVDFCMYCPLTNECRNDEGTCPYAYETEEEQKKSSYGFYTKMGVSRMKELEKENAELKAQIEKMKNVGNCKHSMKCAEWNEKQSYLGLMKFCLNCKDWESAE